MCGGLPSGQPIQPKSTATHVNEPFGTVSPVELSDTTAPANI